MDIQLNDYVVRQREDGKYCATHLLNQVNEKKSERTPMVAYMRKQTTKNLIKELGEGSVSMERVKSNGRPFDVMWFSPYLFIDFVLWVEPSIYKDVYMLVAMRTAYKVIIERDCERIKKKASTYAGYDVTRLVKGLNYAVTGKAETTINYYMSDEDLNAMVELVERLYEQMNMETTTNFESVLMFLKNYVKG